MPPRRPHLRELLAVSRARRPPRRRPGRHRGEAQGGRAEGEEKLSLSLQGDLVRTLRRPARRVSSPLW
ncbi:MAG TPA: hypothetical protein PKE47_15685 [Verrucomicrobiota bacterium]|nr:hypothetical protein [Verrucomicrobiota bacterium]